MRMFSDIETWLIVQVEACWAVSAVVNQVGLSTKAKLFGAVLATMTRGPKTTDDEVIKRAAETLDLPKDEAFDLFMTLSGLDCIERYDDRYSYMHFVPALKAPSVLQKDYRRVMALLQSVFGAAPMSPTPITETLAALRFPPVLQPYYYEICSALQRSVSGFVVPENVERIQAVLNEVSESMRMGKVDERGPVGIIVANLRGQAQVPRREFIDEGEAETGGGEVAGETEEVEEEQA